MTSHTHFVQPPRIAVWLLSLFAAAGAEESILGDLLEEFSQLALKSGIAAARRWYWRQTVKTTMHLLVADFRVTPWSTAAAVAGGFLLRRLISSLPERAIFLVLERYQVFEHHWNAYVFFASTGIDIGHVIEFLLIGGVVALGAKGREMAATITLGLIFGVMAVFGTVAMLTRTGDGAFLWRLSWYFADSFAIIIGGAVIRTYRSTAAALPSNASCMQ